MRSFAVTPFLQSIFYEILAQDLDSTAAEVYSRLLAFGSSRAAGGGEARSRTGPGTTAAFCRDAFAYDMRVRHFLSFRHSTFPNVDVEWVESRVGLFLCLYG
jgi:hypothetical protein